MILPALALCLFLGVDDHCCGSQTSIQHAPVADVTTDLGAIDAKDIFENKGNRNTHVPLQGSNKIFGAMIKRGGDEYGPLFLWWYLPQGVRPKFGWNGNHLVVFVIESEGNCGCNSQSRRLAVVFHCNRNGETVSLKVTSYNPAFDFRALEICSDLSLPDLSGHSDGSHSSVSRFSAGVQSLPNKEDTKAGNTYRGDRYPKKPLGINGHAFLSGQVILGILIFAGSFYLFLRAYGQFGPIKTATGALYVVIGINGMLAGGALCLLALEAFN